MVPQGTVRKKAAEREESVATEATLQRVESNRKARCSGLFSAWYFVFRAK